MRWIAEQPLLGSLLLGAIAIPYLREMVLQLKVQADLWGALPIARRQQEFPRAPLRPALLCFASVRFWLAFRRYLCSPTPDPDPLVEQHRRRLRRSLRHEAWLAPVFTALLIALLVLGWRPF